jgi:hypothetical protein
LLVHQESHCPGLLHLQSDYDVYILAKLQSSCIFYKLPKVLSTLLLVRFHSKSKCQSLPLQSHMFDSQILRLCGAEIFLWMDRFHAQPEERLHVLIVIFHQCVHNASLRVGPGHIWRGWSRQHLLPSPNRIPVAPAGGFLTPATGYWSG